MSEQQTQHIITLCAILYKIYMKCVTTDLHLTLNYITQHEPLTLQKHTCTTGANNLLLFFSIIIIILKKLLLLL